MAQLKTSLIIDLAGNLQGKAQQYLGSMQRFAAGSSRSMQMFHKSLDLAGRGLDRLGNRYSALITGGALTMQIKEVGDLSARFTQLAVDAHVSVEEIDKIKEKIFEVSQMPKIRVDPSEITSAFEEIVAKSGDLKFAQENLENIAVGIRATGARGVDIGAMLNQYRLQGIRDPEQVRKLLDLQDVLGKQGSFILRDMAQLMPRTASATASLGRSGPEGMREMTAILQYMRPGVESSDMAATAYENFIREITSPEKIKILQRNGVKLFDEDARKRGEEKYLPLTDIFRQIVEKSHGKRTNLAQVFERESIRGFNNAIAEYKRTGQMKTLDDYLKVQADGTQIGEDATLNAKEFNAVMGDMKTSFKRLSDEKLIKPIRATANFLDKFGPGTTKNVLKDVGIGAGIVGGAVLARKIYTTYRDLFGGGGSGGLGGLGGFGRMAGPIPVYVVNKHLSLLPSQWMGGAAGSAAGSAAGAAEAGAAGASASVIAAAGAALLPAAVAAAVGALSVNYAKNKSAAEVRNEKLYPTRKLQQMLSEQLVMGGGPNSYQAKLIADELHRRGDGAVSGSITLKIMSDSSVKVMEMEKSHGNVQINLDSGAMLVSH
jgi:hypothetical protein